MSDIVNLANHIVVSSPPGPTVLDSRPSAASQSADIDHADHFPPDTSKPLDPQDQATGAPRPDDDSTSTGRVSGTGAGNFREVLEKRLEKRLSQKSDTQPESEQYKTTSDSDESHHVIVALAAKGASNTGVKVKGTAPGRTHLLSKAAPDARGSAKGQPLQAEQLKTDAHAAQGSAKGQPLQAQPLKTDTTGDLAATFVRDEGAKDPGPNIKKPIARTAAAKNHNVPLSNKKAGADQTQARLNITDSTPKKPARDIDPQLTKDQNADILAENSKTDALLATAKLSPTDAKNAAIASTSHNSTPQRGAKGVQTATAKNQTLAASNGAKSATQKDTPETQAAPAAARTNEVAADTDGSDPATVEVTALGAKTPNVSSALTASRPNSANNAPQTAAGSSSGGIQTAGNMQQSPANQIIDSIRLNIDSPQQQIYISLNPPELGRVRIMFRQINGEITGLLEAENRQTKYDIEQSLPQIVASLHQCGVQVGRVNVILNDQNQQGPLKNNDMGDDDFVGMDKHGFTDQSSDDNSTRPNSPQADTAGHVTRQPSNITNEINDDTINVYV